MLPLSNNLSQTRIVRRRHGKFRKHGFRGMRHTRNNPRPTTVQEENTQQVARKSARKGMPHLSDTLSQNLYRKIFINANFIGIVRNRHVKKQEIGFGGIGYARNDPHLTTAQDTTQQVANESSIVDMLPLIEILSQDLYRKISIGEKFIGIVRNRDADQKNHGFCGNMYSRNDPHPTIAEDQKTQHAAKASDEMLHPSDTLSQSPYRKIFINENFIGIVRNRHMKKQEHGFRGMRYGRCDTLPTISNESITLKILSTCASLNELPRHETLLDERIVRKRHGEDQKHVSRGIEYARNDAHSTIVQDPTQQKLSESSSVDILPLIEILSQDLYRKNFIGENFIGIVRNRHGQQRTYGVCEKRYARNKANHTTRQESNTQKLPNKSLNVEERSLHEILFEKRIARRRHGKDWQHVFPEMRWARNDTHPTTMQDQNTQEVEDTSTNEKMLPRSDNLSQIRIVRRRHVKDWEHGFRRYSQISSDKRDSCLSEAGMVRNKQRNQDFSESNYGRNDTNPTITQDQITHEMESASANIEVVPKSDRLSYSRIIRRRECRRHASRGMKYGPRSNYPTSGKGKS